MGVKQTIRDLGELRCELHHEPSQQTLVTDAPVDNAGRGASFSPTDLVASALASCMITTMAIKAPGEQITLGAVSGSVEKEMTTTPPRKISRLVVRLDMPGGLSSPERAKLEAIAKGCPVALSIHPSIEVETAFHYPDGN